MPHDVHCGPRDFNKLNCEWLMTTRLSVSIQLHMIRAIGENTKTKVFGGTEILKDRHHGIARNESEAKEHEIVNDEYASRVM